MIVMKAMAASAVFAVCAGVASAATVTFGGFVTTTDNDQFPTPIVSVNDDTAGLLSFSISSTGAPGKLSGIFFDISGIVLTIADILNESRPLANFATSTGGIGAARMGGTYTDGTNNPVFDFGMRIGQFDVSLTPFTFQVSSLLVGLSDLERVGLRFQSVGEDGADSAKTMGYIAETPAPIPLPAAGWLLLGGICALAAARRRKPA